MNDPPLVTTATVAAAVLSLTSGLMLPTAPVLLNVTVNGPPAEPATVTPSLVPFAGVARAGIVRRLVWRAAAVVVASKVIGVVVLVPLNENVTAPPATLGVIVWIFLATIVVPPNENCAGPPALTLVI